MGILLKHLSKGAVARCLVAATAATAAVAAAAPAQAVTVPDAGCVVSGTAKTTDSGSYVTLTVGVAGTCAPSLGRGSISISATSDLACVGATTGLGNVTLTWPSGSSVTGRAQFLVGQASAGAIEIDSVVPDPSSRNRRIVLLLQGNSPILAAPVPAAVGRRAGTRASCTTVSGPMQVTGTMTAVTQTTEQLSQGTIEHCDTYEPTVGANLNTTPTAYTDCQVHNEPVDFATAGTTASTSHSAATNGHTVMTAVGTVPSALGLRQRQCETHEFFQPKDRQPDKFVGKVVLAGEAGANPGHLHYTQTATFTSGVTVSASVTVKEDIIIAGAEEQFGVDVHADWTSSNSEGYSLDIPPHHKGYIEYGHMNIVTTGKIMKIWDDCVVEELGTAKLVGPYVDAFRGN